MGGVEITLTVILIISCGFCALVIVDRALFSQKIKQIETGMTGKQIQDKLGFEIHFLEINGTNYTAIIQSKLTIFKMKLVFVNGKLVSKQGI